MQVFFLLPSQIYIFPTSMLVKKKMGSVKAGYGGGSGDLARAEPAVA